VITANLANRLVCRSVAPTEVLPQWATTDADDAGSARFAFHSVDEGGAVVFARVQGNEEALITNIVVDPSRRGLGFGTEAVELLEAEFPGKTFVARVDPADGLNLYFWLRLGYRPDRSGKASAHNDTGGYMITMIREPVAQ